MLFVIYFKPRPIFWRSVTFISLFLSWMLLRYHTIHNYRTTLVYVYLEKGLKRQGWKNPIMIPACHRSDFSTFIYRGCKLLHCLIEIKHIPNIFFSLWKMVWYRSCSMGLLKKNNCCEKSRNQDKFVFYRIIIIVVKLWKISFNIKLNQSVRFNNEQLLIPTFKYCSLDSYTSIYILYLL